MDLGTPLWGVQKVERRRRLKPKSGSFAWILDKCGVYTRRGALSSMTKDVNGTAVLYLITLRSLRLGENYSSLLRLGYGPSITIRTVPASTIPAMNHKAPM